MKKEQKKNKLFIVLAVSLLAVAFFVVAILFFLPKDKTSGSNGEYYPANYDENIFLNHAYMEFQRDLLYSVGGVEQLFSYEEDLESADTECEFFLKYFHTVISGDYESYKSFFVDGYFEEEPKFTMQMIYDPYVRYHSISKDKIDGKEVSLLNFQVSYRIFKNNKTFRSDVDSNVEVPQIYQLIQGEDGSYRIFRILNIEVENAD